MSKINLPIGKTGQNGITKLDSGSYELWKTLNVQTVSITNVGYVIYWKNGKLHLFHRKIYELNYGIVLTKTDRIDHIDQDPLNNCINNLRLCSQSENLCNRGKQKNNTSGHKNVTFDKSRNKWRVGINKNGKKCFTKRYDTLEEAIKVAQEMRIKYHEDYSCE